MSRRSIQEIEADIVAAEYVMHELSPSVAEYAKVLERRNLLLIELKQAECPVEDNGSEIGYIYLHSKLNLT